MTTKLLVEWQKNLELASSTVSTEECIIAYLQLNHSSKNCYLGAIRAMPEELYDIFVNTSDNGYGCLELVDWIKYVFINGRETCHRINIAFMNAKYNLDTFLQLCKNDVHKTKTAASEVKNLGYDNKDNWETSVEKIKHVITLYETYIVTNTEPHEFISTVNFTMKGA